MSIKKDYYEVLGINKNADDKAIKKAYRKLAKKYHRILIREMPMQKQSLKKLQKLMRS